METGRPGRGRGVVPAPGHDATAQSSERPIHVAEATAAFRPCPSTMAACVLILRPDRPVHLLNDRLIHEAKRVEPCDRAPTGVATLSR